MLQSYFIYLGLPLFCTFFARRAARTEKKKYVWAVILLLALVSGLRGYSVGLDTESYVNKYHLIANGQWGFAYGLEYSFKLICYVLSFISDKGTFMLCVFAFLTNALIIWRFWDYRGISSFPWMVLMYYLLLYQMSLSAVRQFCAVSIVFYATRYLDQKKIRQFLALLVVAVLFHRTALIGFVFLFERMLHWKQLTTRQRLFFILSVLASPVAVGYILRIVAGYERYFSSSGASIGLMLFAKAGVFLLALLFVWQMYRRLGYFAAVQKSPLSLRVKQRGLLPGICLFYAIGLALTSLGYIFTYMERIGWYFYLYEGIFYGMLCKDEDFKNRIFFGACILFLVGYAFVNTLNHNSFGTMPYVFFWQY